MTHPLDHVALAVPSLDAALPVFARLFGAAEPRTAELPALGLRVAFAGPVELMEPLGDASPVAEFLARHGAGVHHLAYRVPDLDAELLRLEADGFQRAEPEPRRGLGGRRQCFLHPRGTAGVLVELVEDAGPPP